MHNRIRIIAFIKHLEGQPLHQIAYSNIKSFPISNSFVVLLAHDYASGLTEWPRMLSPFITIQHAHLLWRHIFASSCLQIEQIHTWAVIVRIVFCCLDFSSTYSHSKINGIPIAKNMSIVRTGTLKTSKAIPKHKVIIPRIEIHRVAVSINIRTPGEYVACVQLVVQCQEKTMLAIPLLFYSLYILNLVICLLILLMRFLIL